MSYIDNKSSLIRELKILELENELLRTKIKKLQNELLDTTKCKIKPRNNQKSIKDS